MSRPFIVLGDKTTHGGTVISADFTCDVNGRYLARVGDMVVCPKKGCRGTFAIVSGAEDMISMGQPPARHGDRTACGATLLSSQVTTTWSEAKAVIDRTGAEADAPDAAGVATPTSSGICLDCLRKAAYFGSATVIRE